MKAKTWQSFLGLHWRFDEDENCEVPFLTISTTDISRNEFPDHELPDVCRFYLDLDYLCKLICSAQDNRQIYKIPDGRKVIIRDIEMGSYKLFYIKGNRNTKPEGLFWDVDIFGPVILSREEMDDLLHVCDIIVTISDRIEELDPFDTTHRNLGVSFETIHALLN